VGGHRGPAALADRRDTAERWAWPNARARPAEHGQPDRGRLRHRHAGRRRRPGHTAGGTGRGLSPWFERRRPRGQGALAPGAHPLAQEMCVLPALNGVPGVL
jgi:hypothetical protein